VAEEEGMRASYGGRNRLTKIEDRGESESDRGGKEEDKMEADDDLR